jgi:NTE family protein
MAREAAARGEPRAKKLGLALSGGGAWGGAHLGVLRALDEAGLAPYCVAGTSCGAVAGGFYAAGVPMASALAFADRLRWRSLRMLGMPRLGFFHSGEMERFLRQTLGDVRIEDLRIPVAVVATELRTARPVVFREGPLAHALSASSAIPVVFSPVMDGEAVLVDGGLTDNLPTQVCRGMGAEIVLAVNVIPGFDRERRYHNLFDIAMGTLEVLVQHSTDLGAEAADLCIHPEVIAVNPSDLSRMNLLVAAGERALHDALPRLRELLEGGAARAEKPEERHKKGR